MHIELFNNTNITPSLAATSLASLAALAGMTALQTCPVIDGLTGLPDVLGLPYQAPKQELQIQRFVEGKGLPVSDRTFQHVLGEHFGRGTRFEGNSPVTMTGHLLELLHGRIAAMKARNCTAEDKAQFCKEYLLQDGKNVLELFEKIAGQMESSVKLRQAFDRSSEEFSQAMAQQVKRLPVGESFFFQGGWSEKGLEGGHAIVYEVIKEKENFFTFRIYNRGDGASFHSSGFVDGKNKIFPFTEIEGIKEARLLSPSFLQALQEIGQEPPYGDQSWKSNELYEGILPILHGTMSRKAYNTRQMMDLAAVGHCTYLSWTGLFHQHMGKTGNFERLEYELQFKTLNDYCLQNQARLSDEIVRKLVQKGVSHFARKVESLFKKEELTNEEAAYTLKRIGEIEIQLNVAEAAFGKNVLANIPCFDQALLSSAPEIFTVKTFNATAARAETPNRTPSPPSVLPKPIPIPPFSPKTFYSDLKTLQANLHEANLTGNYLRTVRAVQKFIKAIPMDWASEEGIAKGDPFWQSMTQAEAKDALELFASLGREYYFSILKDPRLVGKVRTADYLMQIKLLSLTDALSRNVLDTALPSLYQKNFDMVLEAASSDTVLFDPNWAQQIESIKTYFEKIDPKEKRAERNDLSFFGLEHKPPFPTYPDKSGWTTNPDITCSDSAFRHILRERKEIKDTDCLIEYEDIKWVQEYLKTPETAERVQAGFPEQSRDDAVGQAMYFAYPDNSEAPVEAAKRKAILPAAFFALRELSILSDLLLQVREVRGKAFGGGQAAKPEPAIKADLSKGILFKTDEFRKKTHSGLTSDHWEEGRFPLGLTAGYHDPPAICKPHGTSRRYDTFSLLREGDELPLGPFIRKGDHIRRETVFPNAVRDDLQAIYGLRKEVGCPSFRPSEVFEKLQQGFRRRSPPHDKMLLHPADFEKFEAHDDTAVVPLRAMNLQDMRELLALSSVPHLQIQEAFGYFNKRIGLLKFPDYQKFFKKLMFEPGLLMREFKHQPAQSGKFANQLAKFCKDQIALHSNLGDIQTALYFLDLNRHFQNHVETAINAYPERFPNDYKIPFLDSGLEYTKLLSKQGLSDDDTVAIQIDRALSYRMKDDLRPEDAEKLLSSAVWIDSLPQGAYQEQTVTWFDENGKAWGHDSSEAFKQGANGSLRGEKDPPSPIPGKIDEVHELLYFFQEETYALLSKDPTAILNNILRTVRPGQADVQWKCDSFPRYASTDGLFAIDAVQGTLFEQGKSIRQIPLEFRKDGNVETFCDPDEKIIGVEIERDFWEFANRKNERYRIVKKGNDTAFYQEIDGGWHKKVVPPFPMPKEIETHFHFWQMDEHSILVSDKENIPYARIRIEQGEGVISKIENGKETDFVLENLIEGPHLYSVLERIAQNDEILVWKKRGEKGAASIEIPHLGLHFTVQIRQGVKKALCREAKGFWIAKNQKIEALGDIAQTLVLEGPSKKTIVLIPNGRLTHVGSGSLETRYQIEVPADGSKFFRYEWKYGNLIPSNSGARLHLSLLRLSEHDYDAARVELKDLWSETRAFTKEERDQLQEIVSFDRMNSDHDPKAAAIRYRALYLIARDFLDSSRPESDFPDLQTSKKLHDEYFQKASQIPPYLRLSQKEEELIFDVLSKVCKQRELPPPTDFQTRTVGFAMPIRPLRIPNLKYPIKVKADAEADLDELKKIQPGTDQEKVTNILKNPAIFQKTIGSGAFAAPSALLRQNRIGDQFLSIYELVRLPLTETTARDCLETIAGNKAAASLSLDQMKMEIESQLALALLGESRPEEKAAAVVLASVFRNPEHFPEAEALREKLDRWEEIEQEAAAFRNQRDFHTARELEAQIEEISNWLKTNLLNKSKWSGGGISVPLIHLIFVELTNLLGKNLLIFNEWLGGRIPASAIEKIFTWPSETWPSETLSKEKIASPFSSSANLYRSLFLGEAPIPNLNEYLEILPPSLEKKRRFESIGKELQSVFAADLKDPVARQKFEKLRSDLEDYSSSKEKIPSEYQIKKGADLDELKKTLTAKEALLAHELDLEAKAILKIANRSPEPKEENLIRHLQLASKDRLPLEMGDVLFRFFVNDAERMRLANHALSEPEIHELYQKVANYLLRATHQQHVQRIAKALSTLQNASENSAEYALAVESFGQESMAKRAYDFAKHPEYLVFEYMNDMLLRVSQVESLDRLKIRGSSPHSPHELGTALEMIMGSGKTAVLTPLIALFDADGKHIPFVVLPEKFVSAKSEQLQQLKDKLGASYDRFIEVIPVDRKTNLDTEKLSRLLTKLESAKIDRKVIVMKSSSVQSLFLKFIEKLLSPNPNMGEVALFRKIFHELRSSGQVTIDEMDMILDILKSHHFTHGAASPLKTEVINAVSDLYQLLAESPEIERLLNVGFLPAKIGKPFTPAYYEETIKPVLVDEILKGNFSVSDLELRDFFHKLNPQERTWVKAYLSENGDPASYGFIDRIPSMKLKNSLAILKEEVSKLLPLTMKKQVDEHYGFVPSGATVSQSKRLAIPFHGSNNPALNAQFGTELEVLNYTLQQYLAKGFPMDLLEEEIKRLQEEAMAFLHRNPNRSLENSPSFLAFRKLCGPHSFDLLALTPEQKRTLHAHISRTPSLSLDLIRRLVLPEIKKYFTQLNTNAQIFSMLFKKLKGFTGTMWNADTFPQAFAQFYLSDTDVKTLHLLWEHQSKNGPTLVDRNIGSAQDVDYALAKIYKSVGKGSFADTGGMFRSFENETVARALLALHTRTEYKGIIYYDSNDELMILERGKQTPIPASESDLAYDERIAYWDQQHTTGSDLKLATEMHAVITISRHTLMRDLLQTAWRLRKLDKGQRVSFAMLEEEREIIATALHSLTGRDPSKPIQLGDIFLYALHAQAQRQGSDNFRALKQKLQNVLIDPLIEVFSDPSISEKEMFSIFNAAQELFVASTGENPYEVIGQPAASAGSEIVVRETVDKFLSSNAFQAFRSNRVLKSRFDAVKMESRIREIAQEELKRLPEKLQRTENYETEIEVETEEETEKELEKETEKEIEKEIELGMEGSGSLSTYQPYPVFVWDKEHLFEKATFAKGRVPDLYGYGQGAFTQAAFKSKGLSPVLSIQDTLASHASTSKAAHAFDSNLLTTVNFHPVYREPVFASFSSTLYSAWENLVHFASEFLGSSLKTEEAVRKSDPALPPYAPFGRYQDSSQHLLVIQDKSSQEIQAMMLDHEDVRMFIKFLESDRQNPLPGKREVKLCLYHLQNGIYRVGSEPIDEKALEKDPAFLRLKTQAKFFNGELNYSEEEIEILKAWIGVRESNEISTLFKTQILAWKPTSKKALENSDIGELLQGVN